MTVHNHGPADGPGLDCGEQKMEDGFLRGHCLAEPQKSENWGASGQWFLGVIPVWRVRRGSVIKKVFIGPGAYRRAVALAQEGHESETGR